MAEMVQPKMTPRARAPRGVMTVLTVRGDQAAALRDMALPAGVELAIVSPGSLDAEDVRKIRRGAKVRLGAPRTVYAEPAAERRDMVARDAFEPDARARALLEGVRIAQDDLRRAGGAYDLEQVRTLMRGVSRQAIDKRVQEGSLIAVPGPSNRRSYPTLQFGRDGAVVSGLKAVREALETDNPWTVLNFLANPDDRLQGRRPIDLLKGGDVALVVEAARRLGQQGA
ncbi:hypothetical protein [Labrys wisconsinensis]|uniref:Antitoxin Xre/MbcA/ParS-like toxin-binding domain-containing protein n=1 Tax=Labrys wisconsinensis TaxID=425677 RepID=A0ABU0JGR0_9HYPH|nr:hypothetical protein [Labrys wisconsinensis]MDQ0473485.1 hypothetical protein [Labrys wisconsinensis]